MKKLSTLFKKDPNDLGKVINEINPKNDWVYERGMPTRKWDGTSCAVIDGELYKRYDAKINGKTGKRKPVPNGAIPCQDPDETTGHWPHWIKCDRNNPQDRYHFEGFDNMTPLYDGTYELCGPKIQGNPEGFSKHVLLSHGGLTLRIEDLSFDGIKKYLKENNLEGIVFHEKVGDRMCKIRKSDFGIKREKLQLA